MYGLKQWWFVGDRVSPDNAVVEVRSMFPGLPTEYRQDGSDVWNGIKGSKELSPGDYLFRTK